MKKLRLLIADDHPIFLNGLCSLLRLEHPEIEIVSAVPNGKMAVEKETEYNPDAVLLDIVMPVMDGIEAARCMRERRKDLKIIMLTTFNEKHLISGAIKAGADGYILKEASVHQLVDYVKTSFKNGIILSKHAVVALSRPKDRDDREQENMNDADITDEFRELSVQERRIFRLILKGRRNKEIAEELHISEGTVRNYISRIYEILGIHNRTALVLWALKHNLY